MLSLLRCCALLFIALFPSCSNRSLRSTSCCCAVAASQPDFYPCDVEEFWSQANIIHKVLDKRCLHRAHLLKLVTFITFVPFPRSFSLFLSNSPRCCDQLLSWQEATEVTTWDTACESLIDTVLFILWQSDVTHVIDLSMSKQSLRLWMSAASHQISQHVTMFARSGAIWCHLVPQDVVTPITKPKLWKVNDMQST